MPTKKIKKIADIVQRCTDREHDPPKHMVYAPGVYEHTCPSCGRKVWFTVNKPTW